MSQSSKASESLKKNEIKFKIHKFIILLTVNRTFQFIVKNMF